MKLGKTVTYPILEGVPLCGSIPVQFPVDLVGEVNMKLVWVTSFPRVCWQPSPF